MTDTNFTIPPELCTLSTCSLVEAHLDYLPSLAGNLTYLAILAAIFILQIGIGVRYRTWGFLGGIFGGLVLEILGYAGRVQMHSNPFTQEPFLLYLICLTIGPAFLTASIYLCLARIVTANGAHLSFLQPRTYTLVFICCDVLSLVLQAVGGAITSTSSTATNDKLGVNIMIAGLSTQVGSLALFIGLWTEFAIRLRRKSGLRDPAFAGLRSSFKFRAFQLSLALATLLIFTRCVYRVAELQGGFGGSIANNQTIFMIFEGPMIIVAMVVLTVFHPGIAFAGRWSEAGWSLRKAKKGTSNVLLEK